MSPTRDRLPAALSDVREIGLIHTGALGDFVLSLQMAARLRYRFPGAAVTGVCRSSHGSLAGLTGLFRRHLDIDTGGFHSLFAPTGPIDVRWADLLAVFDLLLDLTGPAGSVFSRRLGECCRGTIVSVDPVPRPNLAGHITGQWLGDLARAGLPLPDAAPFQVDFPATERFKARARLQRVSPTAGRAIVLLHPGSGAEVKCWPVEHFQNVALALAAESVQPIWMVGSVERDRWDPGAFEDLEQLAPVIYEESVTSAAQLVAATDAFVGNDSGMSHVSALMGTPTVVVFGPTSASVWRPLGRHVRVLSGSGDPASPFGGLDAGGVCREVLALIADQPIGA